MDIGQFTLKQVYGYTEMHEYLLVSVFIIVASITIIFLSQEQIEQ